MSDKVLKIIITTSTTQSTRRGLTNLSQKIALWVNEKKKFRLEQISRNRYKQDIQAVNNNL